MLVLSGSGGFVTGDIISTVSALTSSWYRGNIVLTGFFTRVTNRVLAEGF